MLRGQRTEGYQAIRCPSCGQGVFILPRSPLPEPPASFERPRRPRSQPTEVEPIELMDAPVEATLGPATGDDLDIEWDEPSPTPEPEQEGREDDQEQEEDRSPPPGARAKPVVEIDWDEPEPRPRPRPKPANVPSPSSGKVTPKGRGGSVPPIPSQPRKVPARPIIPSASTGMGSPRMILVPERTSWRDRLRRHRVALVVWAVMILVVGTVLHRLWRQRVERLPEIARVDRAEGLEALAAGHFDLARQKLESAASALETLHDLDSPNVRQAALEAAAFQDRPGKNLWEILDDVARHADGQKTFETLYQGRYIILEDAIEKPNESCHTRIIMGDHKGLVDLKGFHLLEGKKEKDEVLFGARLQSVYVDKDNLWHFTLVPDSGVFILTEEGREAYEVEEGPGVLPEEEKPEQEKAQP